MTMRVLAPITVTPAMLVSSSIPETDHAAYSSGTTYADAARVIYAHRIYESLQNSNTNHTPGLAASATWWLDVGPTNRWAMFDAIVDTASTGTGSIVVTVAPGAIVNGVALVAAIGDSAQVRMLDGATVVYDETQSLDSTPIDDWEDYFFAAQMLAGELVFSGLPRYLSATVEVTLTGSADVQVGVVAIGTIQELGIVEQGASAGIADYSRKETDEFGVTSLVQRTFAKRSNQSLLLARDDTRRVQALLAGLRATPCVWIGDADTDTYAPLVIFGWFRDFQIVYRFALYALCSLEIEGLT